MLQPMRNPDRNLKAICSVNNCRSEAAGTAIDKKYFFVLNNRAQLSDCSL